MGMWTAGGVEEKKEEARDVLQFYTLGEYGNECNKKYMGTACDICSPGHFKKNNQCAECPSSVWLYVCLAFGIVIVASSCCWFLTKYNVNLAVLNIMVDFILTSEKSR